MAFGILSSQLTRRGYVEPQMDAIWSEARTVKAWFTVEVALAGVQAELGIVPSEAAKAISAEVSRSADLVEAISQGGGGNPLVIGLDAIRKAVPAEHRGWVHFGATSQDILDTARALQIRESLDVIDERLRDLSEKVHTLAHKHKDTLMVARTNGNTPFPQLQEPDSHAGTPCWSATTPVWPRCGRTPL